MPGTPVGLGAAVTVVAAGSIGCGGDVTVEPGSTVAASDVAGAATMVTVPSRAAVVDGGSPAESPAHPASIASAATATAAVARRRRSRRPVPAAKAGGCDRRRLIEQHRLRSGASSGGERNGGMLVAH